MEASSLGVSGAAQTWLSPSRPFESCSINVTPARPSALVAYLAGAIGGCKPHWAVLGNFFQFLLL